MHRPNFVNITFREGGQRNLIFVFSKRRSGIIRVQIASYKVEHYSKISTISKYIILITIQEFKSEIQIWRGRLFLCLQNLRYPSGNKNINRFHSFGSMNFELEIKFEVFFRVIIHLASV